MFVLANVLFTMHRVFFTLLLILYRASSFFVPICEWNDLHTKKATVFQVNGHEIVAYKPSRYTVVAFQDHCPHRGASFNNAKTYNGTMTCNYHAYQFAQNGSLLHGLGISEKCKLRLENVPVIRRGNIVWGSIDCDISALPPHLEFEHFEHPFHTICGSTAIKCSVASLIENVIDAAHVSFVHSFGNPENPEPKLYTVKKIDNRTSQATFQYNSGRTSLFPNTIVHVANWFTTPCTASTRVSNNGKVKLVQVHAVDRGDHTTVYWSLSRNFCTWSGFDLFFRLAMMVTLQEDSGVLETVRPEKGDLIHSKFDSLQMHYRRAMRLTQNVTTEPTH